MFFSLFHNFIQADCSHSLAALKLSAPTLSTKPEYCEMTPDNKTCESAGVYYGGLNAGG